MDNTNFSKIESAIGKHHAMELTSDNVSVSYKLKSSQTDIVATLQENDNWHHVSWNFDKIIAFKLLNKALTSNNFGDVFTEIMSNYKNLQKSYKNCVVSSCCAHNFWLTGQPLFLTMK